MTTKRKASLDDSLDAPAPKRSRIERQQSDTDVKMELLPVKAVTPTVSSSALNSSLDESPIKDKTSRLTKSHKTIIKEPRAFSEFNNDSSEDLPNNYEGRRPNPCRRCFTQKRVCRNIPGERKCRNYLK